MKAMLKMTTAIALALALVACGGESDDETGLTGLLSGTETPTAVEGAEVAVEGGEAASGEGIPVEGGETAAAEGAETAGSETASQEGGEAAGEEGDEAAEEGPEGEGDETAGEEGGETSSTEGGEGPSGEEGGSAEGSSCFDILQCGQTCGADENCILACVGEGSPQAQQEFLALNECLATNCPNITTEAEAQQCLTQFCAAQAQQCLSGGGGPGGGGAGGGAGGGQTGTDCQGTLLCMQGCGQNEACIEGCVSGGTPEAQSQLLALAQCTETECADVPEAEIEVRSNTNQSLRGGLWELE